MMTPAPATMEFLGLRLEGVVLYAAALLVFAAGMGLTRAIAMVAARIFARRGSAQSAMVVRKAVFYGLNIVLALACLRLAGLDLKVLLGAAGLLTVAIGFASQTSASNLISGLFLVAERAFEVGDIIRVDGMTGEVLGIDLLSVKLRTFDNLMIRVPNEQLIRSSVTNLTRFPIRRLDMDIGVAYKEDLEQVRDLLLEVADAEPLCLMEPRPLFLLKGYGSSSVDIQFSVWAKRENWLEMRNAMYIGVKKAFDEAGIEIPFPHVSLYAGSASGPIPLRWQDKPGQCD